MPDASWEKRLASQLQTHIGAGENNQGPQQQQSLDTTPKDAPFSPDSRGRASTELKYWTQPPGLSSHPPCNAQGFPCPEEREAGGRQHNNILPFSFVS